MRMDKDRHEDAALELLFEAAQEDKPKIAPDFLERLALQAEASVPVIPAPTPTPRSTPFWQKLSGLFAASGLSGAAALGVWMGIAMPDLIMSDTIFLADGPGISEFLPSGDLSLLSE